ncbi:MAG: Naphthalene 1,2-dioxygenase system ferredoxin subunit [Candidatus Heimdallarchaeota archaeon LC_3]|nr:MAG: Naphthalene 1,2-dioxygenase system ferredoxin subunit [Candidatus Heimdallarchaeota archaeon LC_3]
MSWLKITKTDTLSDNQLKAYTINNEDILLVRFKGIISAFQNSCTHADVPLSIGWLNDEGNITCAMHHAEFNSETGKHIYGPGSESLKEYSVRERNEWIEIYWEDELKDKIMISEFKGANRENLLKKIKDLSKEFNLDTE